MLMNRPDFEELGARESLLGSRTVGFIRWVGGTTLALSAAGLTMVGLAALEARFPVLRRIDVPVPARPGLHEFTILHISDLHMFPGQHFIRDFLAKVARNEAIDMVVSTGDNLEANEGVGPLLEALEPLLDKPGAFVLGSHDYYSPEFKPWISYVFPDSGANRAKDLSDARPNLPWLETVRAMTRAGWVDLTNQAGTLAVPTSDGPHTIAMIGVDDPHIHRDRLPTPDPAWYEEGAFRLAVAHAPYRRVLDQFARLDADLIMAGHTHGGQIRLPGFGAIVNNVDIPRRYSRGLYDWPSSSSQNSVNMHLSAGLGVSHFAPIRLFCRPEATLLRVCPTD